MVRMDAMTEERERMSAETRELLGDLTPEDIATIRAGLPVIKAIIGFGRVTKWIAITVIGLFAGAVLLGESIQKLIGWFWPPPHP